MNVYDRIINILLEARVEGYLERLNEAHRPGGSVQKLRDKLKLAPNSNPGDKDTPFGQDARAMDASLMRAARNPRGRRARTDRQIHRDARSSEDQPWSRTGY